MIVLEKICKTYKSKKSSDCVALKNVSLKLGSFGLYFILGKSGSGKSTLLNVIGGLDKPDSGEIIYNGNPISNFSGKEFDDYRNREIGFVFQDYNLLEEFDVFKNIGIALELQGEKDKEVIKEKVKKALVTVGLEGYEKRKVNELSGGQKQRVSIARAIVKDSTTILADEPTGNLDSETGGEIFELLKKISKEKLVIVVSHDRDNAVNYSDGIIEIKDGVTEDYDFLPKDGGKEQATPKQVKAKLPLSYSFGIATHNLFQKKFKVVLTILSTIFLLLFTCGMYVFYDFNSERDIMLSAQNQGVNYINIAPVSTNQSVDSLIGVYQSGIKNFAVYDYLQENDIDCLPRYKITNFKGNISLKVKVDEVEKITHTYGVNYSAYIINGEKDLTDMGLTLYANSEDNENGIYLTDMAITSLLQQGYSFAEEVADFNQMGGKEISRVNGYVTSSYLINGVIQTELYGLYPYENGEFNGKTKLNERQTEIFNNIVGGVFIRLELYAKSFCPLPSVLTDYKLTATTEKGDKVIELTNVRQDISSGYFIITENGKEKSHEITLGKDQILINVDFYNLLFADDMLFPYLSDYDDSEAVFNLKHLGEKLNFAFKFNGVDQDFLDYENKEIVGVVVEKDLYADNVFPTIYSKENVYDICNPLWRTYVNNERALLYVENFNELDSTLKDLREDYLMLCINQSFNDFYRFEIIFNNLSKVFLILLAVSLVATVILLINLISFGVSARTKEIGILRALGTGSTELKKAYIIETLIIATIAFILGVVLSVWFVGFANSVVIVDSSFATGLIWFVATPVMYALMAFQTFILMPLLALIPLKAITRLNPVDAIKK